MNILVINGPNLNLLGQREKSNYGELTLEKIEELLKSEYPNDEFTFFQSNHEGEIIDEIQNATENYDALIINPGGVGQPRDGDPRASYALYDSEAQIMYHWRVNYDITITQKKMMEHKLPLPLVLRLNYGY